MEILAARYKKLLSTIPGLGLPEEPTWARGNWQSFCVRLPERCSRQKVMRALLDENIACRHGILCAHRLPAYEQEPWSCGAAPKTCDCPSQTCSRLAKSDALESSAVILPLYPQMSEADQDRIVVALSKACAVCTI